MKINIDYPLLFKKAEKLRKKYSKNSPFPNIVIDNFFNKLTYKNILKAFPNPRSAIWKMPSNSHTVKKKVTKRVKLDLKEYLFSENQKKILRELNSSLFLNFLEKLSGIEGLIPDPYFAEASFACALNGGKLDIHADFSHHDKLKLERRLNVLIYLNDNWKKEYKGSLNLYDKKLNLKKKIFPIGNRLLVFTTSNTSFHGYPETIKAKNNIYRKSINMYYYTIPRKIRVKKRVLFPSDPNFKHVPTKD